MTLKKMVIQGKVFSLSGFIDLKTKNPYSLCRHSYQRIYGYGPYTINSLKEAYTKQATEPGYDQGVRRVRGDMKTSKEEAISSMKLFFDNLAKEGEDYASRKVITALGSSYSCSNDFDAYLPRPAEASHLSIDVILLVCST